MNTRIIPMTPECKKCKQRYIMNPHDALPAMVGFKMEDGSTINICRGCLEKLGKAIEQDKSDEFFKDILGGHEHE